MARKMRTAGARRASSSSKLVRSLTEYFEDLERRQLLAGISYNDLDGGLSITGDALTTSITVDYSSSTDKITAMINSAAKVYKAALIHYIRVSGSDNADYITVTNSIAVPVTIHGNLGNDTIYAGAGHDRVYGDDGNDLISGRNGDDLLYGGNGNDTLDGSNGNDTSDGGAGSNNGDGRGGSNSVAPIPPNP